MDVAILKEVLETVGLLILPIAGLVLTFVEWKRKGKLDLEKTLEHAGDVLHIVLDLIEQDNQSEDEAIEKGVDKIAEIRGKKNLPAKLRRKARARLKSLVKAAKS